MPRHLPRLLPRHSPAPRAIHTSPFRPIAHGSPSVEALLRTCQLFLIIGFAMLGAQWAAKGLVWAGAALVALLHSM